jgi:hypothetical protein
MDTFDVAVAEGGPTLEDLATIAAEWPLIEAEIDLVDAEARLAAADRPSELDWRALRRAETRVLKAATEFYATRRHVGCPTGRAA